MSQTATPSETPSTQSPTPTPARKRGRKKAARKARSAPWHIALFPEILHSVIAPNITIAARSMDGQPSFTVPELTNAFNSITGCSITPKQMRDWLHLLDYTIETRTHLRTTTPATTTGPGLFVTNVDKEAGVVTMAHLTPEQAQQLKDTFGDRVEGVPSHALQPAPEVEGVIEWGRPVATATDREAEEAVITTLDDPPAPRQRRMTAEEAAFAELGMDASKNYDAEGGAQ